VKAKKRVVTSADRAPVRRRTPTVRRVKSAFVTPAPAQARPRVSAPGPTATAAELAVLDAVDLSVDLGRGLVL
jgi:hypothetical protein